MNKINLSKDGHNDWPPKIPRPTKAPNGQGYQPDGRNKLDTSNPPQGGSGIPKKECQ